MRTKTEPWKKQIPASCACGENNPKKRNTIPSSNRNSLKLEIQNF